jgi:hypothetical protein
MGKGIYHIDRRYETKRPEIKTKIKDDEMASLTMYKSVVILKFQNKRTEKTEVAKEGFMMKRNICWLL